VRDVNKTMTILGFLTIFYATFKDPSVPMGADFLDDFLMLNKGDSYVFAGELASVVALEPAGFSGHRVVNLVHASLSDFLLDRSRSNQFYLDPAEVHAQLASMCLQSLQRYFSLRGKVL
jgi:hypothetical protein